MGTAYEIMLLENAGITPAQAEALLESGFPTYKNLKRYLEYKAEGCDFKRIRFPRYMVKEIAILKSQQLEKG